VSTSRIYESGYRRYDGPRLGPNHAFRALVAHTLQRIFGLHRPARTKVLPFLITIIAYVPPAVFVGLAAFLPKQLADSTLPEVGDLYGFISAVVILFVMFVAPEALCPDRRSGVLSLYLAAPFTRARYLAAKAASVFIALLFVTVGPPLLFLVGLTLQSAGPDGVGGWALMLFRVLASGVVLAVFYTSLSMAASSLTDRRAIAAAGTFIVIQASTATVAVLVFGLNMPDWLLALSMSRSPFELTRRIHGLPESVELGVGTVPAVIATVGWTVVGALIAWRRYQKLQVTR
jgi:ABC-2 type transport system permease protein